LHCEIGGLPYRDDEGYFSLQCHTVLFGGYIPPIVRMFLPEFLQHRCLWSIPPKNRLSFITSCRLQQPHPCPMLSTTFYFSQVNYSSALMMELADFSTTVVDS
jgi:hypothetical protein